MSGGRISQPKDEYAPTTRTASVYEALREDLLAGRFQADARLGIGHLANRYGTGSTPIREVLNRLSAEGFVVQIDQRGFRVPPFSDEELTELARTRCLINEILVREAIINASGTSDEVIVLAHHRLERREARAPGDTGRVDPDQEKLHRQFHSALIAPCGSRWLVEMHERLFEQSTRYRLLAARPANGERDSAAEHFAIMNAFLDREIDRAIALLNDHIRHTARIAGAALPA